MSTYKLDEEYHLTVALVNRQHEQVEIMGVTLKISKPLAREYFISGETVSGSVELGSCRLSTVSSINVYLEGSIATRN